MVISGALALLFVEVHKALPFFSMEREAAIQLSNSEPVLKNHGYIWIAVVGFNIVAAWVVRRKHGLTHGLWYRLPYLLALAGAFALLTFSVVRQDEPGVPSEWHVFYVSSDSNGYVQKYFETTPPSRPPVYSLFVQAVTAGTGYEHTINGLLRGQPIHDSSHPLMRVAKVQKIILLAAGLLACFAMMGLIDPPFAAILFLLLYDYGFYSWYINHILSEPLTQAFQFLLVGAFLAFTVRKAAIWLPAAGLLCALTYLTRPASVFVGLFPAVMIIWALISDWRKYWRAALLSVVITGGLVGASIGYTYIKTGLLTPSPMYYVTQIAFALEVAEPEDAALMPDEASKQFLIEALERKEEIDHEIIANYPDEYQHTYWIILSNPYQVALPLANEMVTGESAEMVIQRQKLLLRVAAPILRHHRLEHLKVGWHSFMLATQRASRIVTEQYSFWTIIAAGLVTAILLRGRIALVGGALMFSHLAHLFVVTLNDSPSGRYVGATEYLVIMGLFILAWGLLDKIFYLTLNWNDLVSSLSQIFNRLAAKVLKRFRLPLTTTETASAGKTTRFTAVVIPAIYQYNNLPDILESTGIRFPDTVRVIVVASEEAENDNCLKNIDPGARLLRTTPGGRGSLINAVESIDTEWVMLIDPTMLKESVNLPPHFQPDNKADMVAGLRVAPPAGAETYTVSRPLSLLGMLLSGCPLPEIEKGVCLLRKKVALKHLPAVSPGAHLPLEMAVILSRQGYTIHYAPTGNLQQKQTIKEAVKEGVKKLRGILEISALYRPLRLVLPVAVPLLIPGLWFVRRVLSGRGGVRSLLLALLLTIAPLIMAAFGFLYNQIIKARLEIFEDNT